KFQCSKADEDATGALGRLYPRALIQSAAQTEWRGDSCLVAVPTLSGEQTQETENMDLNTRIIQAKEFLIASPEGKFDFENAMKLLLKLARENAEAGQFDILLDIRGAAFDSLLFSDITGLVQVMIDNRDSFRSKLAILTSLGCEQFDKVKFLVLYAG